MNECVYASLKVRVDISFMSAPAAKAFWDPVRIMADIEGDLSNARRASFSSLIRGVERALRALGRLSVTEYC
jgi:hypothetical protein